MDNSLLYRLTNYVPRWHELCGHSAERAGSLVPFHLAAYLLTLSALATTYLSKFTAAKEALQILNLKFSLLVTIITTQSVKIPV